MDELYKLAYEYKKSKLWTRLMEFEVFAIKFDNGKIGYISISGWDGIVNEMLVIIGEEAFYNYRNQISFEDNKDFYDYFCKYAVSEFLKLGFYDASDLEEEDLERVKDFRKRNNVKIGGVRAFPKFSRKLKFTPEIRLKTARERDYLKQAMEASIELAKIIKGKSKQEFGLDDMFKLFELPIMERVDGKFIINGTVDILWDYEVNYPSATKFDKDTILALKKLSGKKKTVLDCELVALPTRIEDGNGIMRFPQMLMVIDEKRKDSIQGAEHLNYLEDPNEFVDEFLTNLLDQKIFPSKIKVADERTFNLLKNLQGVIGIEIEKMEEIKELIECKSTLMTYLTGIGDNFEALD